MKILVVYYSRTGHTKKIGDMIADALKCDHEEIVDTKKRSGIWGWLTLGKDATKKDLTKIKPPKNNPSSYDMVVIGTPIHSWGLSSPVRTYIRENKDKFKNVAFFCTCDSSGMERAFSDMEKESGKKPVDTMSITKKELKNRDYTKKINQFIKSIKS